MWNTEWSGVLFYNPTGNFEDGSLEIHCVDILPMDIGNATYTEFTMSPDVISYMAENQELLDCKMGLIHSHNNMATFFSGTDINTLKEEGDERNHFVSLIVNNAGKYSAAITRKVKYHSIKKNFSYASFNGDVPISGEIDTEVEELEYFDLDIVFEEPKTDQFQQIALRLDHIKETKKYTPIPTTTNSYTGDWSDKRWGVGAKMGSPVEIYGKTGNLFDDKLQEDKPITYTSKQPSFQETKKAGSQVKKEPITKEDVRAAICQLITGSVAITNLSEETFNKISGSIDARFESRFKDLGKYCFDTWASNFVDFILFYSIDKSGWDTIDLASEYAKKIIEALKKFPKSKYIDMYIGVLNGSVLTYE